MKNIARAGFRYFRSTVHRLEFARSFPLGRSVAKQLRQWEERHRIGDPTSSDEWDAQYQSGEWDYLSGLDQTSRHGVIVGYLQHLKRGGAILDLGCGAGTLFKMFRPYGYSLYHGVDISNTALASLADEQSDVCRFDQGDIETFVPKGRYDAIVFDEVLYYMDDPIAVMKRYATHLNPDGIIIISIYRSSARGLAIIKRLKEIYYLLSETKTEQSPNSWLCTVFAPSRDLPN